MLNYFPSQADLHEPILKVIRENGGSIDTSELYDRLAREVDLSKELLKIQVSTGEKDDDTSTERKWNNIVRHTIRALKKNGDVVSHYRGNYSINE